MNAIVMGGGRVGSDGPLFPVLGDGPKVLADVGGKPMAQWVLDAVSGSPSIREIVFIGLENLQGLQVSKPIHHIPDQGSLIANTRAALDFAAALPSAGEFVLMSTADIPLITSEMVTYRAEQIQQARADLDYCVVDRSVMERRFPTSKRSYVHLKDVEVCGGDIHGAKLGLATDDAFWKRLMDARKSALKQAMLLGFDTTLMLLFRLATLAEAEAKVSRRVGLAGRVQLCPFAEVGMDVDKPHQLALVRHEIEALSPSR
jgi:molybdopterin-guanine dinucleotide biosynthesis protein A